MLSENPMISMTHILQVWCQMTPKFYREYLNTKTMKRMVGLLAPTSESWCQHSASLIKLENASINLNNVSLQCSIVVENLIGTM